MSEYGSVSHSTLDLFLFQYLNLSHNFNTMKGLQMSKAASHQYFLNDFFFM